jgi:hypothetical protein
MENWTIDDMLGTKLYDTDAADKSRAGQGRAGQGRAEENILSGIGWAPIHIHIHTDTCTDWGVTICFTLIVPADFL